MNVPKGYALLRRNGGRATVREMAAWSEAPRGILRAVEEVARSRAMVAAETAAACARMTAALTTPTLER